MRPAANGPPAPPDRRRGPPPAQYRPPDAAPSEGRAPAARRRTAYARRRSSGVRRLFVEPVSIKEVRRRSSRLGQAVVRCRPLPGFARRSRRAASHTQHDAGGHAIHALAGERGSDCRPSTSRRTARRAAARARNRDAGERSSAAGVKVSETAAPRAGGARRSRPSSRAAIRAQRPDFSRPRRRRGRTTPPPPESAVEEHPHRLDGVQGTPRARDLLLQRAGRPGTSPSAASPSSRRQRLEVDRREVPVAGAPPDGARSGRQ